MTAAKTVAPHRPSQAQRPKRRRDQVQARTTLTPIIPPYLVAKRRLRTRAITIVPMVFLAIGIGLVAAQSVLPIGVIGIGGVFVVVSLVVGVINRRVGSPDRLLRSLLAGHSIHPPSEQLTNLLEGLCVGNGLPVPTVHIMEDEAANAISLGWSESAATLVITTGLLAVCGRIELEGVLAHELTHIKSGDLRDAAFGSVGIGTLALVSPRVTRLYRVLLQPTREAFADLGGVSMTRYPPGLMRALVALQHVQLSRPRGLTKSAARITAPLWLINLDEATLGPPRLGALDLDDRIRLLAEL